MPRRVLSKNKELVRKGDAMLIAQMNTLWRVRVLSKGRSLTAIVMLFTAAFFIRSCTWGYAIWSRHKVLLRDTPCQRRSQQGWLRWLGGFGRRTWGHPVLLETLWWQDRQTLLRKKTSYLKRLHQNNKIWTFVDCLHPETNFTISVLAKDNLSHPMVYLKNKRFP